MLGWTTSDPAETLRANRALDLDHPPSESTWISARTTEP